MIQPTQPTQLTEPTDSIQPTPEKTQAAIATYLDAHWSEMRADIASLVAIPSTADGQNATPASPHGPAVQEALDTALGIAARLGFSTSNCDGHMGIADFPGSSDDTSSHDTSNTSQRPQLGIIGHLDVVPAGPGWDFEPFALSEKDGYLTGRGVIDDKGPSIICLHAARCALDMLDEKTPYDLRFLFGTCEETSMGDVKYYRSKHNDPDFLFTPDADFPVSFGEKGRLCAIISSPNLTDKHVLHIEGGQATNAVPGIATATVATADGSELVFEAHGKSAHASTPELGDNAIALLIQDLLDFGNISSVEHDFLKAVKELASNTDCSCFGKNGSDDYFTAHTHACGMISVSDGRFEQSIDVRYSTSTTAEDLVSALQAFFDERCPGCTIRIDYNADPYLINPDDSCISALMDAFVSETGRDDKPFTMGGGTYARLFSHAVSFGAEMKWVDTPEWVGRIHSANEAISEDLLKQTFGIYVKAFINLCAVM